MDEEYRRECERVVGSVGVPERSHWSRAYQDESLDEMPASTPFGETGVYVLRLFAGCSSFAFAGLPFLNTALGNPGF